MVTQITSPSAGFTGTGATGLQFTDGQAYTSSPYEVAFYRQAGYGIGGAAPTGIDSRTVQTTQVGTTLGTTRVVNGMTQVWDVVGYAAGQPTFEWVPAARRVGTEARDAAVSPRAGDYHAPINAGLADPHGPDVRANPIDGRAV